MAKRQGHQFKKLDPDMYHEDWNGLPKITLQNGANLEELHMRETFIVKLSFYRPEHCTGTGFYINIPDVRRDWYTCNSNNPAPTNSKDRTEGKCHHIILTAGHNLIGDDRNLSTNVKIERAEFEEKENEKKEIETVIKKTWIDVSEDQVMICDSYRKNPGPDNSRNDWGAIFLESDGRPHGFGINLLLGLDDREDGCQSLIQRVLQKNQVTIAGHLTKGSIRTTTGPGSVCSTGQIEYEAQTEPGISGSPVWVPYQGLATVVAIHAYGGRGRSKRSRGTRISFELLETVYKRAGLGYFSKVLKASQTKKDGEAVKYPKGLYLRFPGPGSRARVRLGADGLQTTFDVLPAATQPSSGPAKRIVYYAFRFHAKNRRWVLWNSDQKTVSLVSSPHPACLVRLSDGKKFTTSFQVACARREGSRPEVLLQLGTKRLRIEDEDMGIAAETSEVVLAEFPAMQMHPKAGFYNHFWFEDSEM
ncbi:uncharacterized protein F4807DRAFT_417933 [Annulohypoxylon truncatum]|uniref:uncharacterized protein n=1 Tax=Annulohypoxylon truncatum TaxID=327061 RepID=UPI00200786F5|nr:uncharacterized protein F4807DRAFT_417933 [Annulohypoxylon truncatum]KAI1211520.1 hypothetical protein F4807DRAFT_417933 [Annulohypoxylon truncatum]